MKFAFAYGVLPMELRPSVDPTDHPGGYGGIAQTRWKALHDEILVDLSVAFVSPIASLVDTNRWNELTAADWSLMDYFRPQNNWGTLAKESVGFSTRGELFDCEDAANSAAMAAKINGAQVAVPCGFAASFALMVSGDRKFGYGIDELEGFMYRDKSRDLEAGEYWLLQSLKKKFQRPRPYQVAYDWGDPEFLVKLSSSAQSASLPSGHCMQSLLYAIMADARIPPQSAWASYKSQLPAWAAGVADRRIYAGLHYPSDNFASWIAVGRMIPAIFESDVTARKQAEVVAVQSIKSSICWGVTKELPAFAQARALLTNHLFEGLT